MSYRFPTKWVLTPKIILYRCICLNLFTDFLSGEQFILKNKTIYKFVSHNLFLYLLPFYKKIESNL